MGHTVWLRLEFSLRKVLRPAHSSKPIIARHYPRRSGAISPKRFPKRKGPRDRLKLRGPNAGEEGLETRPRLFD